MSSPSTAVIPTEKIDVEDGFNPRKHFDPDRLAELEASIRQDGLVTALTVKPTAEGRYTVIAGERRLIAAKRAGLREVPVVIREGSRARAVALVENLLREGLDPIETAQGLADLAEEENLTTHKRIAERVGMSPAYVSEHLRLLALPEGAKRQVAAGLVPVAAERDLRKVAEVSPRIAECACELVERGEIGGRDLLERFGEVLQAIEAAEFEPKLAMVEVGRAAWLSEVVPDQAQFSALAERIRVAQAHTMAESPMIRFSEHEIDAARAAGCLLEHEEDTGGWSTHRAFLCDAAFAADLAVRAVGRIEQEGAKRARQMAERSGVELGDDSDPATLDEQIRASRKAEREKAKGEAEAARTANLDLGRALIARRGAKSRKEQSLARAKAVAAVVLADNENLAARGLRLVLPQLQEVDVKELKSGEKREHVIYKDPAECSAYLAKRIEEARTPNEILELLADALIAATQADERELPQSRRVQWWTRVETELAKLLAPDLKALRPRRRRGAQTK